MNENTFQDLEMTTLDATASLNQFIGQWNFVNVGVIKKIHNPDYVDVRTYYLDNLGDEIVFTDVRLLHVGTASCKINIEPTVGDNVLLLCPKDFIEKLKYNEASKNSDFMFGKYTDQGMCGIIVKAETDDEVKTTINIDKDGNISLSTDGDTSVNVGGDASVTVDGDATVDIGGDSTLTVEGDASIDATGDLKAETKGDATIKATKDVKIDCVNAEIKSSAKTSVKLGATTAFEVALA
jgi:hypothetical protein